MIFKKEGQLGNLHTFFAKHLRHEALLPGRNSPQIVLWQASGRPLLLLRADIHLCGNCGDTCHISITHCYRAYVCQEQQLGTTLWKDGSLCS